MSAGVLKDWDLRRAGGGYVRLKRREGESDAEYIERRLQHAAQAATHKTFLMNPDDYEDVAVARNDA